MSYLCPDLLDHLTIPKTTFDSLSAFVSELSFLKSLLIKPSMIITVKIIVPMIIIFFVMYTCLYRPEPYCAQRLAKCSCGILKLRLVPRCCAKLVDCTQMATRHPAIAFSFC
jgi:hypothetical protein